MNCVILNGNPRPSAFDALVEEFAERTARGGDEVALHTLRDEDIAFCNGCWSCWWATPGRCSKKDDMEAILRESAGAGLVVFCSPLILGTMSSLIKKVQDRLIPLVHPYIELVDGECHHRRRYPVSADIALIVEPGKEDGPEEIALVRRMHERLARNFRSRLRFASTADDVRKEAKNEAISA